MTGAEALEKAEDILPLKVLRQHVSMRSAKDVYCLLALAILRKANEAVDASAVEEIMNHGR